MPYFDINPHRTKPKWRAYVGLGILAVAAACAVYLVLSRF